jgi:sulfatase maturation enzyme AslB (radical SAM superfamily)
MENNINIMLSLDGSSESQAPFRGPNNNPQSVYRRIVENVKRLNERKIPYFANAVVSPSNVDKMEENLLALKDLGITTMQFGYELGALWERENRNKYVENLLYCIDKYHTVPSGDDPGFQIQNTPSSEPMLGNPFFACDVDGRLYQGCAVVLEKTLPTFNETAKIGHVHDYQTLEGVQKDRLAQVKHFLDGTRKSPEEYRRLHSNMHLGYQVRTALHAKRHNV